MNLFDFSDVCGIDVVVYHSPGAVSKWIAKFDSRFNEVFFKRDHNDCMASSPAGWGATTEAALLDFLKNIKEYGLVVVSPIKGQSSRPRTIFNLPKELSL
jgi:hypothetical protein